MTKLIVSIDFGSVPAPAACVLITRQGEPTHPLDKSTAAYFSRVLETALENFKARGGPPSQTARITLLVDDPDHPLAQPPR